MEGKRGWQIGECAEGERVEDCIPVGTLKYIRLEVEDKQCSSLWSALCTAKSIMGAGQAMVVDPPNTLTSWQAEAVRICTSESTKKCS